MRQNKKQIGERGASTVMVLGLTTVLLAVSAVLVSQSQFAKNYKNRSDKHARAEQRHRAAFTRVSALVNSGALWFDRANSNYVLRAAGNAVTTEGITGPKEVIRSPVTTSTACGTYAVYEEQTNAGVCGTEAGFVLVPDGEMCGYTDNVVTEGNAAVCGTTPQYEWQANADVCGQYPTYTWMTDAGNCGTTTAWPFGPNGAYCGYGTVWVDDWDWVNTSGDMFYQVVGGHWETDYSNPAWCNYPVTTANSCDVHTGWAPNSCSVHTGNSTNICPVYKGTIANSCPVKSDDVPITCSVYVGQAPKSCNEFYTEVVQVSETRPKPPPPAAEIACTNASGAWQIPSGKSWCIAPHDRAAPTDGKVNIKTYVCENRVGKDVAGTSVSGSFCNASQTPVEVTVVMQSYKEEVIHATNAFGSVIVDPGTGAARVKEIKYWANAKATSLFNGETSSSFSDIYIGTTSPSAKIDLAVSDTDFCYFMRPVPGNLDREAMIYDASGKTNISQTLLRPRNEGRTASEYAAGYDIAALTPAGTAIYSVMKPLRDKAIGIAQSEGYRGMSVSVSNGARDRRIFMGVEPHQGSEGGPEFLYYLEDGRDGSGAFSHAFRCTSQETMDFMIAAGWTNYWYANVTICPTTSSTGVSPFDPAKTVRDTSGPSAGQSAYSSACSNTTGVNADFCNRVDMPWGTAATSFNKKCVQKVYDGYNSYLAGTLRTDANVNHKALQGIAYNSGDYTYDLPGGYSSLKDEILKDVYEQVSCLPEWPESVKWFVGQVEALSTPAEGATALSEIYIQEIPALLDLDMVALEPMFTRIAFSKALLNNLINIRVSALKNVKGTGTIIRAGDNLVYKGDALRYGFKYYEKKTLSEPEELAQYTAKRCVYMLYTDITKPKQCSIKMIASDESGLACRTSDGCFAEDTLIRLADGSEKEISQLAKGDLVWNPVNLRAMAVKRMTVGPEKKPMSRVFVEGRAVDVTDGHPFMTQNGWKKTAELNVGDMVKSASGAFSPVTAITALPVGANLPTVYNLALEGDAADDHYVLANGVVTGDLYIQEKLEKR